MAANLAGGKNLPHAQSGRRGLRPGQAEVLRARHVSLSQRLGPARGASGRLHGDGHHLALPAHEGLQRPAPDGLGRLRPARRAARHQDRRAPAREHGPQRRQLQAAAHPHRLQLRLGPRGQHDRPRLFPLDPMDLPAAVRVVVQPGHQPGRADCHLYRQRPGRRAAGVRVRSPGELVPGAGHGAGERGSYRRQERDRWLSCRAAADAPVDAADHGVRGTAHQGTRRPGLAGIHQALAAQLDRAQRGGARAFCAGELREPADEPRRAGAGHRPGRPSRRRCCAGRPPCPPGRRSDRVHHAP